MRSLFLFFATSLLLASLSAAVEIAPAAARPNIIFILVDDLGWGDLGALQQNARAAAGKPALRTPNLDAFAHEGARLTQHYCSAPVCAPSRASLLSGVHQGHAGVRDNQFDKALEDNHTLASVMKRASYATCAIGKWGLQGGIPKGGSLADSPAHPQNRGFDSFFGYLRHVDGHDHYPKENPIKEHHQSPDKVRLFDNRQEITDALDKCYTTDLFTARAKDWITRHHAEKPAEPFFLYLSYDTPHAVLELPSMAYPPGGGLDGGLRWLGTPGHMINTAQGTIDSFVHPDFRKPTWPAVYQRYATSVRRIDDAVGDLVRLLKDLEIDRNTLVVFTSDNGPETASYVADPDHAGRTLPFTPEFFASYGPFEGIKRDCLEGGIRVPTFVRWPGHVSADAEIRRPSSFPDWMPTFTALAGMPSPARADGVSLVADLTGQGTLLPENPVYVEYFEGGRTPDFEDFSPLRRGRSRGQMQMIRMGDKVGVRYGIRSQNDDFEIYDVTADPGQRTNLATQSADLERALKDTVLRMRRPNPSARRPYDSAPVPALALQDGLAPGLSFSVFANSAPWVPSSLGLVPLRSGHADGLNLAPVKLAGREAVVFNGFLKVPANGEYVFTLSGKGRAFLRLHDAAIVDADQGRLGTTPSGKIILQAGLHPIHLTFSPNDAAGVPHATPEIKMEWEGPGLAKQEIPGAMLAR